ncbi:MAG TPA: gamma-glutamylcyclotransferase [Ramlibacter sp.]|jgi:cation transport protein ChaC|nr:gamma-glutamylcyclotransferase [Ramlibacter sp.]
MTHKGQIAAQDLRRRLQAPDFDAQVRRHPPPGVTLRTREELEHSFEEILAGLLPGEDLHVFGYGSLMWNPGLEHIGSARAALFGWHRRFCIHSLVGRGAPEAPGLMLALDRGGSCSGMVFRIQASKVRAELAILWRREMTWGSYQARWVSARIGSTPVRAVTFVVDRSQPRYLQQLGLPETARLIATGCGQLGTCRAYFDATLGQLRALGIADGYMERLDAALRSQPRCQ